MIKRKSDLRRVIFWIALALFFNAGIYYFYSYQKALDFFTGYLIEYSLSVDNLFVFIMIFSFFGVNASQQHKALAWGIAGAVVFRMFFVLFGVALIHLFHEIIYVFGALLLYSAYKMAFSTDEGVHPEKIAMVRWFRKAFPVTKEYVGDKFFARTHAGLAATPLLIVVMVIESSDIMFAIDSIPAILAITTDPFIVITSNIFAILGLRSLYFLLADVMDLFRFLKLGVSVILAFVGLKMLLMDVVKMPTLLSLGIILLILATSIVASKLIKEKG
jgi:tellurite resistance protein TerC